MRKLLLSTHFLFIFFNTLFCNDFVRDSLFNFNWKFQKGSSQNAELPEYDDSEWRLLSLPHDWSIEDLEISDTTGGRIISGPFDSDALWGVGFTRGGTGWYRKHFTLPKEYKEKIITIHFDGVYTNSDVWINGYHLGNHAYGHSPFSYDLTNYLNFGTEENVIAVEVKNEGCTSRWYTGSGIHRNVFLNIRNQVYIDETKTYVKTITADSINAKIDLNTSIFNKTHQNANIHLTYSIFDSEKTNISKKKLYFQVHKKLPSEVKIPISIPIPQMWSPDNPRLYTAVIEVSYGNKIIDKCEKEFGIKTQYFDPDNGFFLNDKHLKIKGAEIHSNNGSLGAAAFPRAEERKVELIKSAGFNAVRVNSEPPSEAFLNACDKIGLLVIYDAFDVWTSGFCENDYHKYFKDNWRNDLTSLLLRDRNHPSIFAWSIGNQIHEKADSLGISTAHQMTQLVRSLDTSRPVLVCAEPPGSDWMNCDPNRWRKYDPFFAVVDVCGYPYQISNYELDHKRLPNRVIFPIENTPRDMFNNWQIIMKHDFLPGGFEWSTFDYIGEISLGWWGWDFQQDRKNLFPWTTSYTGDFDICGFKKPRSYYRDILFRNNKLSVFVYSPNSSFEGNGASPYGWDDVKSSWTWSGYEDDTLRVVAYSNCDSVRLFLNDKFISTETRNLDSEFKTFWNIPYEPGVLKAIGYSLGKIDTAIFLKTSSIPKSINLKADRKIINADGQDLCYITVEITDDKNNLVAYASNMVNFEINGPGEIIAVGNSNPKSIESFKQPFRRAYEGKCLLIIKSTEVAGQISIIAKSEGLESKKIFIEATK